MDQYSFNAFNEDLSSNDKKVMVEGRHNYHADKGHPRKVDILPLQ